MLMRRLLASDWQGAQDSVASLKNDPMHPSTQCTLYCRAAVLIQEFSPDKTRE